MMAIDYEDEVFGWSDDERPQKVLTLRDHFATAALTSLGQSFCRDWRDPNDVQIKWMAEGAYKIADAMLAARGGK